ncbi:hypothetical protein [Deinococcus enclensis]|uniref:Uncharacterized protein n=1 Tax=Deinococcus enclensis TaxID=1049582 RepID=A0ABT9MHT7_9DEIO|nr:hypothetical protein [Deinococcus enclensis]MDP9766131.1 hypothetical protein [Deinococcus enclensis]
MSLPATDLQPFLQAVHEARALPAAQARADHSAPVIERAINGRYVARSVTPLGPVYSLGLRGRRAVGLSGMYKPSSNALVNAAALHVVRCALARDHEIEDAGRRFAFQARQGEHTFLCVARYSGFTREGLRRLILSLPGPVRLRVYVEGSHLPVLRAVSWECDIVQTSFHAIPPIE